MINAQDIGHIRLTDPDNKDVKPLDTSNIMEHIRQRIREEHPDLKDFLIIGFAEKGVSVQPLPEPLATQLKKWNICSEEELQRIITYRHSPSTFLWQTGCRLEQYPAHEGEDYNTWLRRVTTAEYLERIQKQ